MNRERQSHICLKICSYILTATCFGLLFQFLHQAVSFTDPGYILVQLLWVSKWRFRYLDTFISSYFNLLLPLFILSVLHIHGHYQDTQSDVTLKIKRIMCGNSRSRVNARLWHAEYLWKVERLSCCLCFRYINCASYSNEKEKYRG